MISMSNQIVAGIDIHKDFLVVTVLREHDKFAKEYGTEYLSLCKLKRWLARLKVSQIAIEATGVYMVQCLDLLKDRFEMYLVNAADTKHIPGKKTDLIDSHWLATLLQKGLLRKSYIAPRVWREIRELVRQRIAQTQTRTRVKNRLHKILVQEGFYVSRIFTDIMGGTSRLVIEELVAGLNIKEIIEKHKSNRYILRALDKLTTLLPLTKRLSHTITLLLKLILNEIDQCNLRIRVMEDQVLHMTLVETESREQLRILLSVPGISEKSAKAVLAEIGEISRFQTGRKLVSYAGLAPGVYESGGKKLQQRITKRGNKYLRTSFVEIAHSAVRTKRSRLRLYYSRLKARIGGKKAIVALAAKLMRIVHALLTREELYVEDYFKKNERLLYLPESKQVLSLKELDTLLRGRGLKISVCRR